MHGEWSVQAADDLRHYTEEGATPDTAVQLVKAQYLREIRDAILAFYKVDLPPPSVPPPVQDILRKAEDK